MTCAHDHQPVQTFGPDGSNEAFRGPIRLRHLNRRAEDSDALRLKYRVEAAGEFGIVIADQKSNRLRTLRQRPRDLPGLLRDPLPIWMGRAAGQIHAAGRKLDEEQHVQPLEPDRVDAEEIHSNHTVRLRTEELTPRWAQTLARWAEVFLAENLLDRSRRNGKRAVEPVEARRNRQRAWHLSEHKRQRRHST